MTHTIKTRGLILHEWKVFLCRPSARPYFTLPGGTIEPTDDSLEAWCAREILEELWVHAIVWEPVHVREFVNKNDSKILEIWFRINNPEDFIRIESTPSHGHEIADSDFYDIKKLWALTRPENLMQILDAMKKITDK